MNAPSGPAASAQVQVLKQRLFKAAQALENKDMGTFRELSQQLQSCARAKGAPVERLLRHALNGLSLRSTGRTKMAYPEPTKQKQEEIRRAAEWYAYATPYVPFLCTFRAHANFKYLAGKDSVHAVDFGAGLLIQWLALFDLFAAHPGSAPKRFRMTVVDLLRVVYPRRRTMTAVIDLQLYGGMLAQRAAAMGIRFEFEILEVEENAVRALRKGVVRKGNETIVIGTTLNLMYFPDTGLHGTSLRDSFLEWARSLEPAAFVVAEMEMDACGVPFLERFKAAVEYYLSLFDLGDAVVAQEADRTRVRLQEELFSGSSVLSLTSCDTRDLTLHPEARDKMHRRFERAGFRSEPLDSVLLDAAAKSVAWHQGSSLVLEDGALSLAWRGVPHFTVSLWK